MSYDMSVHIPTQMEFLLNALVKGDERVIDITIGNIKNILNDDNFTKDLDDYKTKFDKTLAGIEKNALERVKNGSDIKTLDDIVYLLNQVETQRITAYNDFINNVKTFIILYMKMIKDDKET